MERKTSPETLYQVCRTDGSSEKILHTTALPFDAVRVLAKLEELHPDWRMEIVPIVNGRVA